MKFQTLDFLTKYLFRKTEKAERINKTAANKKLALVVVDLVIKVLCNKLHL